MYIDLYGFIAFPHSLHVVGQHDVAVVMEVSRFWAFDSFSRQILWGGEGAGQGAVWPAYGGFELLIWVPSGKLT